MSLEPVSSPPEDPLCPDCGESLLLVGSEVSSGAFRTQAVSMPQRTIYFFDCAECGTCWKYSTRMLPDPVRQTLRDVSGTGGPGAS